MKNTCFIKHSEGFFFKVYGYGLCVNNRDTTKPLFSIRNGYRKELRLGKWGVQLLKPSKYIK
jgi:hypothetical protein